MPQYGSHPLDLSQYLEFEGNDKEGHRDWSIDILINLARAYQALVNLEGSVSGSTYLDKRQLVLPSIERAWREALHIRASLSSEYMSESVNRPIKITRLGVVRPNEKTNKRSKRRNPDGSTYRFESRQGIPKRKRGTKLYHHRGSHR